MAAQRGRRPLLPFLAAGLLAGDPRLPGRELVKRVHATGPDLDLRGDAPGASTDSRTFGLVPVDVVRWRARLRYWPPGRLGLL